jgi:hypothetical protein
MKVNYSVTLEAEDLVDAINIFLQTKGVDARIDVEDFKNGLNDDMTLDIETSGNLPSKAPVKRRRRATKVEPDELQHNAQTSQTETKDESKLKPKQVVDEKSKDGCDMRDQTILEESNEANKLRLVEERKEVVKAKAVDINDVDEENSLVEGEAESETTVVKHTAEEIVTNAKNSSVPLAKQGIFKKRAKKV